MKERILSKEEQKQKRFLNTVIEKDPLSFKEIVGNIDSSTGKTDKGYDISLLDTAFLKFSNGYVKSRIATNEKYLEKWKTYCQKQNKKGLTKLLALGVDPSEQIVHGYRKQSASLSDAIEQMTKAFGHDPETLSELMALLVSKYQKSIFSELNDSIKLIAVSNVGKHHPENFLKFLNIVKEKYEDMSFLKSRYMGKSCFDYIIKQYPEHFISFLKHLKNYDIDINDQHTILQNLVEHHPNIVYEQADNLTRDGLNLYGDYETVLHLIGEHHPFKIEEFFEKFVCEKGMDPNKLAGNPQKNNETFIFSLLRSMSSKASMVPVEHLTTLLKEFSSKGLDITKHNGFGNNLWDILVEFINANSTVARNENSQKSKTDSDKYVNDLVKFFFDKRMNFKRMVDFYKESSNDDIADILYSVIKPLKEFVKEQYEKPIVENFLLIETELKKDFPNFNFCKGMIKSFYLKIEELVDRGLDALFEENVLKAIGMIEKKVIVFFSQQQDEQNYNQESEMQVL